MTSWAEVTKKNNQKKRPVPPSTGRSEGTNTERAPPRRIAAAGDSTGKRKAPKPQTKFRTATILVNTGSEDFQKLARKMRGGVSQETIGDHIVGMRQAKTGGLLFEVRGDVAQVEAVRSEIANSAGEDVVVKLLNQNSLVEIRDLDQWSTKDEVAAAIASTAGVGSETIKS